jgi:hypothetical protein
MSIAAATDSSRANRDEHRHARQQDEADDMNAEGGVLEEAAALLSETEVQRRGE